jgi:transcriptional regulator with XRE-family HTH domain
MLIDFPARVRSARARLGLTQVEAAELMEMSRGGHKQLEDRPRDVRLSTLTRLVQAGYSLKALARELTS